MAPPRGAFQMATTRIVDQSIPVHADTRRTVRWTAAQDRPKVDSG